MTNNIHQFRCSETLIEKVKDFGTEHNLNKSEAIRNLITLGLDNSNVVTAAQFKEFLLSLGYDRVSDIPDSLLDNVTDSYIQWAKTSK